MSSPTERSGDSAFVIPDGAKRRSGTAAAPLLSGLPDSPLGLSREQGRHGPARKSLSLVQRYDPNGCAVSARLPAQPKRAVRERSERASPVPDLRFAASGMTRRLNLCRLPQGCEEARVVSSGRLGRPKEAGIGEVCRGFPQLFNHSVEDGETHGRIGIPSVLQRAMGFDDQGGYEQPIVGIQRRRLYQQKMCSLRSQSGPLPVTFGLIHSPEMPSHSLTCNDAF